MRVLLGVVVLTVVVFGGLLVGGVVLAFTKETGVLLYAVLIASWMITQPRLALGSAGSRRAALERLVAFCRSPAWCSPRIC